MSCKACKSNNLRELDGELTVSQPNLNGLKDSPVYICRSVLVCLDCGFTELTIASDELRLLKKGKSAVGS